MIKAVFFDWFNTLAGFNPPREELYRQAFQELKIDLSLKTIYKGLQKGDRFFFSPSTRLLVRGKSLEERLKYFTVYPRSIGQEASLSLSIEEEAGIIRYVLRNNTGGYALFADVLPLLQLLEKKNLVMGIITNADQNVFSLIDQLGITPHMQVIVTSEQVGVEKPAAPIFETALRKAGVLASEMLYVGDQYQSDVLGAAGAGCRTLLIDRYHIVEQKLEYPVISSLSEVINYLE